ncbi:MAG TPA: GNAT family N-acetyltransferase [Acidobacteriaceae bacterium]|nr:GNAT family N-acetyltransferase [Acidobacteriaceae bacterium]
MSDEQGRGSAAEVGADATAGGLLDNPIWGALTTDHAHWAVGDAVARRYPAEIGPLSGMAAQTEAGYAALRPLAGPGGVVGLFFTEGPRPAAGWTLVRGGTLDQMVAERPELVRAEPGGGVELRQLTAEDAPAMVELAELTEPGPFRLRTIELGKFFGVLERGRLLAMAGQRLRLPGYVEVSGVCTHPEARGRGYAQRLMSRVMEEILREGRTPFLHSYAHNEGAIRVYRRLGFVRRRSLELAVVRAAP